MQPPAADVLERRSPRRGGATDRGRWLRAAGVAGLAAVTLVRLAVVGGSLNRVWAEDGTIFVTGALRDGFPRVLGATYQGYLLLAPRLLAEVVAIFPVRTAGTVIAVLVAGCMALLAAFVIAASAARVPSPALRGLLGLAVVLLPVGRVEVVGALANLQWPLLFAAFWALVMVDARPALRRVGIGVAALAAMTCPITLVYAPIAAYRLARSRVRADRLIPAAFLAGCLVQVVAISLATSARTLHQGLHGPVDLVGQFLRWVVTGAVVWPDALVPSAASVTFGAVVLVTLAACAIGGSRWSTGHGTALLALVYSGVTFAAPVYSSGTTTRYAYVPALLLLSALAMLVPRHGIVPRAVTATLAAAWLLSLPAAGYRVSGPTWAASVHRAGVACGPGRAAVRVPVAPFVRGAPWGEAVIPCSAVRASG